MFKNKQFDMTQNVIFLGREEERADMVFYWDNYISRRHAKIAREGDDFYIWDLNSANGTWVDGQRLPKSTSEGMDLNEAVQLHSGSLIQLGPDLKLQFDIVSAEEGSPPPPAEPGGDMPTISGPGAPPGPAPGGPSPSIGTPIPLYPPVEPPSKPEDTPTQVMNK
ncbi:MAG TPA: FHA domain-containing protein [Anaerolineae bacterium]|nr:FHA domain-containing protein [Anaerolineae bacterium]